MRFRSLNVRARLTIWYLLALTCILVIYTGSFITLVFRNLRDDLDRQLEKDYEIVEEYITVAPDGTVQVESERDPYFHERWFDIWSPDGKLLYANRSFTEPSLPPLPPGTAEAGFRFQSLRLPDQPRLRIMSGTININGHWFTIRLIHSEERLWREMRFFLHLLLLVLPAALLIAGAGGYFLARRFLAPLDQMAAKAREISDYNLEERLPVLNPEDELGRLSLAINELLMRLEEAFLRLKRFTSDAAHELRTPLTVIRSIGEVGIQRRQTAEEYREMIGSMLEENQRLTRLVDHLLFLSRADAGTFEIHRETISGLTFLTHTMELIQPLAEEKNQNLRLAATDLSFQADRSLLEQALLNLVDNAMQYSPEDTAIILRLTPGEGNAVHIQVIDQGPGIPPEHQSKIFERFYRVDSGRSREKGGAGLGLSIANWAIRAQGGTLRVDSIPGTGSIFTIELPQ